ncbi:MAG: nucleotidyltransferase family protein [Syntrophomonadaceae bacterium]|jgi:predicted nucleotidyltransferase|nr:nucleotidyltransferase family protein [Syntrophomonadaceae bacterium]
MNELHRLREHIIKIAQKHGASNIRVFGSVARGEDTADSDIDFLMDFNPGRSLVDLVALKLELEDLLGRKVDIVTEQALLPRIRKNVLQEAVEL